MCSESTGGSKSWYFIGIGGVSMSALACLLQDAGAYVRGSDAAESHFTRMLSGRGIHVHIGETEKITEDHVVYTGAIGEQHPQLTAAISAGKRLMSRAELLGKVAEGYSHVLSVAGCHGKTTTTCMLSHILYSCGAKFTCHIGGEDVVLGNYFSTGREFFVTEACEFKRSFLSLKSDVAAILNCDRDHTDCYRSEEELFNAYATFAAQARRVVVNADDRKARKLPHALSFGLYAGNIRAEDIRSVREKYVFTVSEDGIPVVPIKLNVEGKVHIYNALAAYACARLLGFSGTEIKRGLEDFRGVRRRFEHVGNLCGVPVVCDYAHHPREIAATLSTAQKLCMGTVRTVFQPHTYTRTRDFMEEFAEVLKRTERPIVYSTYSARETFDISGSAAMLVSHVPDARYVQTPTQLRKRLTEDLHPDDLILVLGAGDIDDIAKSILD